jgi:hypothetical protein
VRVQVLKPSLLLSLLLLLLQPLLKRKSAAAAEVEKSSDFGTVTLFFCLYISLGHALFPVKNTGSAAELPAVR